MHELVRTLRLIATAHLNAWAATLTLVAGAMLPGAQRKNRAARVYKLVARSARTRIVAERDLSSGERLEGVEMPPGADLLRCSECHGVVCDGDPCNSFRNYCHKSPGLSHGRPAKHAYA